MRKKPEMKMRIPDLAAAFAIAAFLLAVPVRADDAVGVLRAEEGTHGLLEVRMPFAPLGDSGPFPTYHETHDSFAEAFAKRTRSAVFGTDRKANFCNGQITGSLFPPRLHEFRGE